MFRSRWFLALFLLVSLALFLRFYKLGQVPVSFYVDEVAILVDAQAVAQTGKDMHGAHFLQPLFPSYGDFKLPVYIWLSALVVKFFGSSLWVVRLPSVLAGLGSVVLAGVLARQLGSFSTSKKKSQFDKPKLWQLFSMLTMTIAPWSIMFSRTGFEGHLGQFFLLSSITVYLWDKRWSSSLAAFFASLAVYSYFSVRFVWPVIFTAAWMLKVYASRKTRENKFVSKLFITNSLKDLLLPLAIFAAFLLPMFHSPFYAQSNQFRLSTASVLNTTDYPLVSNQYRQQAGSNTLDRAFFHRHYLLARELLKNYSDHLSFEFLFLTGDSNLRHGTGRHGVFLSAMTPFFFLGLFFLAKEKKHVFIFLILWWFISILPASVPEVTPHALRSLNALVPLALVISYGMACFFSSRLRREILLGAVVLLSLSFYSFWYHYSSIYPVESAASWQDGAFQAVEKLYQLEDKAEELHVAAPLNRMYLWLLADGPYSAKEYQEFPKENFEFRQVGSVSLDTKMGWDSISVNTKTVAVMGQPGGDIKKFLDDPRTLVLEKNEILDAEKEVIYLVALLERQ